MENDRLNWLTGQILDAAIAVHRIMGPGLVESIYEQCLMKEFEMREIRAENQVRIPLVYKGHLLSKAMVRNEFRAEREICENGCFSPRNPSSRPQGGNQKIPPFSRNDPFSAGNRTLFQISRFARNLARIIELKTVEVILPVHEAQLISYLKLADKKVGLLMNFKETLMKNGYRRFVNNF